MTSSTPCGALTFTVTEQLGPLGTIAKLPIDYREAVLDFTCWLEENESVTSIQYYGIVANPETAEPACVDSKPGGGGGSWTIAFSCGTGCAAPVYVPSDTPVDDDNPLSIVGASVQPDGKQAVVLVGEGTAGLTYGVSFLAQVAPTQRRKAVDILVCVGTPMVPTLVAPPPPTPIPPYQFVTGSIDLPIGAIGSIFINNTSNTAITITLPPMPVVNQNLVIKDILGNAATYPITIKATGYNIDGAAQLVLHANYSWAELTFTGVQWVQV